MSPCRCMTLHPSYRRIPVMPSSHHALTPAHDAHSSNRRREGSGMCAAPSRLQRRRRLRGEHRHRHPGRSREGVLRGPHCSLPQVGRQQDDCTAHDAANGVLHVQHELQRAAAVAARCCAGAGKTPPTVCYRNLLRSTAMPRICSWRASILASLRRSRSHSRQVHACRMAVPATLLVYTLTMRHAAVDAHICAAQQQS